MDALSDLKSTPLLQTGNPNFTKMISTSSRPLRALVVAFVLVLIYLFQPFTGGYHQGNAHLNPYASSATATSSGAPHPMATKDAEASMANGMDDVDSVLMATEAGPRIRKATMIYDTDKFNAVYERSVDSHIAHGKRWGNPTHILRHDVVDAGFFNKPAFLLGLVIQEMSKSYGQRADWIVWFDADTVILNPEVSWNVFLPPPEFDHINVLASKDQNGFNAGMMLLRVDTWTVNMLAEVISLRQLRPEVEFPFYDQGATKWVIERPDYEERVLYQPHDWWNAFGLAGEPYNTDRFLLHFAGVDCCGQPEKKTTVIGRWLDIVENHPEKYATPLANTTYPVSVSEYWKRLKTGTKTIEKAQKWAEDGGANSGDVEKAAKELQKTMMRNADDAKKMTAATKKLEELITKPESPKPENPKQDSSKSESKSGDSKSEQKSENKDSEGSKSDAPKSEGSSSDSSKSEGSKPEGAGDNRPEVPKTGDGQS